MYVVQRIYEFARTTPDAPAMVHDLQPISYRAFQRMITAMRRVLGQRGLAPGGVAVVWINSILVSWIVNLALRSLGLTTVSIYSAADLDTLSRLDVVAILTARAEAGVVIPDRAAPGAQRIVVDPANWTTLDAGAEFEPPPSVASSGHIMLTSGTTGRPKLIMLDADAEAEFHAHAFDRYHAIGGLLQIDDRNILINLLNFGLWTVGGYTGALMAWSVGAGVIFHQAAGAERSFAVPGITHAFVTPAYLAQLLAVSPKLLPRNDGLQLLVGGGALSMPLAEQAKARLTSRIASTLGSTEGGGIAMTPIETAEDLVWHRLDPARVVEIVDEDDRPVPMGEVGQVRVLQTNGVHGYLGDPIATLAFFRDGYFYPGDLGVVREDGRLALSGRVTEVLSVLGDKIPAAPVERAFQEALNLDGVCAFSDQGADGGDQLHVALETAGPIDPAKLQVAAEPALRHFPNVQFHYIDKLPRNLMGKIDRFRLRQMIAEDPGGGAAR